MKKGLLFTIIAYAGIWLLIGIYWLSGQTSQSPYSQVLAILCMFMPLVATIITQKVNKEPILRGLGIDWKPNLWWLFAWLLPVFLIAAVIGVSCLLPGFYFSFENPTVAEMLDKINSVLPEGKELTPAFFVLSQIPNGFFAGITINGVFAFGEEIGWRGYLLKQFAGKKFLPTAIIIGAIWGLWHAPLILMGHNFPEHPVIGVFVMVLSCICLSPIVQYIRVKSGSVIAAAIFHGTYNAFATFVAVSLNRVDDLLTNPAGLAGIIVLVATVGILYLTDKKTLTSTI